MSPAASVEAIRPAAETPPSPGSAWDLADESDRGRLYPAERCETPGPSGSSIAIGVVFGLGVWCLIGYVGFELYEYLS